jgi:hypothetical protein
MITFKLTPNQPTLHVQEEGLAVCSINMERTTPAVAVSLIVDGVVGERARIGEWHGLWPTRYVKWLEEFSDLMFTVEGEDR